jgi:dethiobiotin synthetase
MSLKIFITGTDTNIGKTYISTLLLKKFNQQGYSTLGIKPIASGCENINGKLVSADALALQQASSIKLPYELINPIALQPAIAPHIAATQQNIKLTSHLLREKCEAALNYPAQVTIIEGAGGWHTPLNDNETLADFVTLMKWNVILVVGIRLGCLNHALLTYQAMLQAKVPLLGWVANCLDPSMEAQQENIETLQRYLTIPCLNVVPFFNSSITGRESMHGVIS